MFFLKNIELAGRVDHGTEVYFGSLSSCSLYLIASKIIKRISNQEDDLYLTNLTAIF